jgi:hypothetical protein
MYIPADGSEPMIPVLDPITIATHLHAYYVAASDELIKYLTGVADSSAPQSAEQKTAVKKRLQKVQLGMLITALRDGEGNLGNFVGQDVLWDFMEDFRKQVAFRQDWRNRWATYLFNWLAAGPIALATEAHLFDLIKDFPWFFLQMANCYSRASETPQSRELLQAHFEQPANYAWVRKYVLGHDTLDADLVQAIRKLGTAPLEQE